MTTTTKTPAKSWRDVIKVHPAADLFPMMSPDELKELGEDIKQNGLTHKVVMWSPEKGEDVFLLDGRNRLDALEQLGIRIVDRKGRLGNAGITNLAFPDYAETEDPFAYVLSANVHRRHLSAEQKRDLIAKVLKAQPTKSNRTIAKQTKVDDKTVGKVRRELEGRAEIPHVDVVEDTKGRKQPAKKKRRTADDFVRDMEARKAAKAAAEPKQVDIEEAIAAKTEPPALPGQPINFVTVRWLRHTSSREIATTIRGVLKNTQHDHDHTALQDALTQFIDRAAEDAATSAEAERLREGGRHNRPPKRSTRRPS